MKEQLSQMLKESVLSFFEAKLAEDAATDKFDAGVDKIAGDDKEEVKEGKEDYTIKHKTYSSAVQHAHEQAEKRGYEIDPEEWHHKVASGPKKPSAGKTNRLTIELLKGGKPQKKALHIQVYNEDDAFYELNMYIS